MTDESLRARVEQDPRAPPLASARAAAAGAHAVLLLGLPAQHARRRTPTTRCWASASAATRWCCSRPQGKGTVTGITQMGGEGAQFVGIQPFTENDHFVQNVGDGTFHHSASLAIRFAAASGANVTYKILYNDTVAMTGGQDVLGQLKIPELTRWLELEGVQGRSRSRAASRRKWRRENLSAITKVHHRDDLAEVQAGLAKVKGVTVLIHDQPCAAELRRTRKRGKAPEPAEAHLHRRARLRGLRRLRREVQLPVGPAGRHRVRPQDPDPPGVVQQGLLVRQGRLPLLPRGHPAEADKRDRPQVRRRTEGQASVRPARARAARAARRLHGADAGRRRDRRGDRVADHRHGRDARRQVHARGSTRRACRRRAAR